jgi:hypothetical protein
MRGAHLRAVRQLPRPPILSTENCLTQECWYIVCQPYKTLPAEGLARMAQKTVVTVVCDLPHEGEIEGTETVSFAFDGTGYEIDVCSTHAKDLREKFGKYVEHARRVAGGGGGRRRRSRSGPGRERSSEIRAWAKQRGHKVSERGRIPAAIIAEYESSH